MQCAISSRPAGPWPVTFHMGRQSTNVSIPYVRQLLDCIDTNFGGPTCQQSVLFPINKISVKTARYLKHQGFFIRKTFYECNFLYFPGKSPKIMQSTVARARNHRVDPSLQRLDLLTTWSNINKMVAIRHLGRVFVVKSSKFSLVKPY